MKDVPRLCRDIHKALSSIVRQEHRLLISEAEGSSFNCVQIMALRDEQILAAIIVVVKKSHSPTRVQAGSCPDATHVAVVGKAGISAVVVEGVLLVGKIGDDKIGQPSLS